VLLSVIQSARQESELSSKKGDQIMTIWRNSKSLFPSLAVILAFAFPVLAQEVNLLAIGEGALPVLEPPTYSSWPVINLLDDSPSSGWCSEEGKVSNNVFVFELAAEAILTAFEFDTAEVDGDGRGAKDLTVEVSSLSKDTGFQKVLQASLQDRNDNQRFPAQTRIPARFVRLTLLNNMGDPKWVELMAVRAYGTKPEVSSLANLSGTYKTNWNDFHLRQQGTALTGCYEFQEGLFDGSVEGRVVKLTWTQSGDKRGPAVFVFEPEGRRFRGYWWYDTDKGRPIDGDWTGERISDQVGTCPHWSGSLSGELEKDLKSAGRARLYGILFDIDSAKIRAESLATLDEVVKVLAAEPSWKITIEGHTDTTGTAAHNQTLSEQRARAVKDYLVSKGIPAERLATGGFGQTKPVADNATELGRAQNRRVELVRN
jgi:outer membrane protein OmpA-like peptidoglycan-associated protein